MAINEIGTADSLGNSELQGTSVELKQNKINERSS